MSFSNEFSGARLNACAWLGNGEFEVTVSPENVPINPSPWFGFHVWSERPSTVTLNFHYTVSTPRGRPWLSRDGTNWARVPAADFTRGPTTNRATLRLKTGPQPVWVSAWDVVGLREIHAWEARLARRPFVRESVIGHSLEGRPLSQFVLGNPTAAKRVLIVARQHPPEITGTLGMMSFVDTLAGNSPLAEGFRQQFQTQIVPLVNPDGVEHGHWRSNLGGVDLNRDWRAFTQPETLAARDALLAFGRAPGAVPLVFLDFHSTGTNIFYAQPPRALRTNQGFTTRWLAAIRARCPDYRFEQDDSHNTEAATSKAWAVGAFGIPAITAEFGYNTDRDLIRRAAQVAAEEMMHLLLGTAPRSSSTSPLDKRGAQLLMN